VRRVRARGFGLGHVGVTTASRVARDGHKVVGVDVDKVADVAAGKDA
jgi:UDP-N-acetyl-D-mannosaminuronate dehydrogenase